MERKTIILYALIVILGLGLMVGVVLVLRARNAPSEVPLGGTGTPATGAGTDLKNPVRPFTPIDQIPVEPPWKEGDPIATGTSVIVTPDGAASINY